MEVYFAVIGIAIIIFGIADKIKFKYMRQYLYFISFTILFVFSGIRYNVGYDYAYRYVPGYNILTQGGYVDFETIFKYLNLFVYKNFNNIDVLFFISSFLTVFLIYRFIFENSSNRFFSIFLLIGTRFYFYSFTQIRQYIAIAIFLCAIKFIDEKKPIKYIISICIAAGFHKIALIYLPIYFIRYIKFEKKIYILIVFISVLLEKIVYWIYLKIAPILYNTYVVTEFGIGNTSITMIVLAFYVIVITICFYDKIKEYKNGYIFLNLQLIEWILAITTQNINEAYRIVALFMYSSIILIPMIYSKINKKEIKILFLACNVLIFSLSAIVYLQNDPSMLPYTTIFNKK